jgi:CheY-like chemotaxis protein
LYVEDHPVNVLLMQALFERLPDERLLTAGSVAQAETMMSSADATCALLLLDIGLPDGRGTDLLKRLRELPSCRAAPAVAVTAECGFDIDSAGFDELWEKPLDLPRVLMRLRALLGDDVHVPAPAPPTRGEAGLPFGTRHASV